MPEYMAAHAKDGEKNKTLPVVEDASPAQPAVIPAVDNKAIAQGLILEAEMLEAQANKKKEEAYQLAPDLKPGRGRPSMDDETRAKVMEERKEKRRNRDRENAAKAKIEKKVNALEDKLQKKIVRDANRKTPVDLSSS